MKSDWGTKNEHLTSLSWAQSFLQHVSHKTSFSNVFRSTQPKEKRTVMTNRNCKMFLKNFLHSPFQLSTAYYRTHLLILHISKTYPEFPETAYTSEFWMIWKFSNPEHFRQHFFLKIPILETNQFWNLWTYDNNQIIHTLISFLYK